jgi:peroxiredoxin
MKLKLGILIVGFFAGVAAMAQPAIGSATPDISLKDLDGNTVSLSSLRGKVVLLDFWASWCGPCRKENKHLINTYAKFKAKGFEIYSVSLDDDKRAWQQAIKQDRITWLQVNDGGGWDAAIANQWNIQQIPTTYLIDKDGKIIARDVQGKQLESKIKELLK